MTPEVARIGAPSRTGRKYFGLRLDSDFHAGVSSFSLSRSPIIEDHYIEIVFRKTRIVTLLALAAMLLSMMSATAVSKGYPIARADSMSDGANGGRSISLMA